MRVASACGPPVLPVAPHIGGVQHVGGMCANPCSPCRCRCGCPITRACVCVCDQVARKGITRAGYVRSSCTQWIGFGLTFTSSRRRWRRDGGVSGLLFRCRCSVLGGVRPRIDGSLRRPPTCCAHGFSTAAGVGSHCFGILYHCSALPACFT